MVRSMWLPVTSGVASLCVGVALYPSLASTADGLSVSAVLFGSAADAALIRNPLDALFQKLRARAALSAAWSSSVDHALQDLRVGNVSVHRVRYERGRRSDQDEEDHDTTAESDDEDETLVRSLFGSAWAAASRKAAQPISSVVITWEDHALAAEARPEAEAMCSVGEGDNTSTCRVVEPSERGANDERDVLYEVQVWVNGWGFDAFWHPANRKISTKDPFVVVNELPQEQELGVRVRMKVQTKTGLLSGFFATEVDGPWSDVVTLSPSKEHAIEAIIAFFIANKFFGAVLAFLIGLSSLIILRLVVVSVFFGRARCSGSTSLVGVDEFSRDHDAPKSPRRRRHTRRTVDADLEQEVADLRQELADSEAEVRRLMLFRGYGIEGLKETELKELERELRHSLKLVQRRRRLRTFDSLEETEEEDEGDDDEEEGANHSLNNGRATRNGVMGTVFEEDV